MLKAGALYYAIFISFLVALLGGFFIMSVWMQHAQMIRIVSEQRLTRNVNAALLLAREAPTLVPFDGNKDLDLFGDEEDMVSVSKSQWGGYCLLKAVAWDKHRKKSAIMMCGKDVFVNEKYALYLADKDLYLSVSGNTLIKGDCYLPRLGIRSAYIEGNSFLKAKMTEGKVFKSKSDLPTVSPSLKSSNIEYFEKIAFPDDSMADISLLFKTDTLRSSFYKKSIVLNSNKWITISDKVLQGNIRIVSSKGVTITNIAQIKDIIIYAPKIEIESGFTGNLQLFASDTILINDKVNLLFPSFIAINESQNHNAFIGIGKGCTIAGDVILTTTGNSYDVKAKCSLNENSTLTGRIFCKGSLEPKGTVKGTVYTNKFVFITPQSTYENNLLNATIDFSALPLYYSGALFNEPVERYKMIKWMH